MAYFITTPSRTRIGRSQGATIFWGLISVCFAAGACFYYYKSTENQKLAERWQDQTLQMQDRLDALQAQKDHLQAGMVEQENQVKAREELVQEKETELATEEMRVEGVGRQNATIAAQNQAQVGMVKKFNEVIRKLDGGTPPDVVERSGRPVLRVPNAQLFAAGDSALTSDGKTLLTQIAQAIVGPMDTFELRVVCYTDLDAEGAPGTSKKDGDDAHAAGVEFDVGAGGGAGALFPRPDAVAVPERDGVGAGRCGTDRGERGRGAHEESPRGDWRDAAAGAVPLAG